MLTKITKIERFLLDLSGNPTLEIPIIYIEIAKKWLDLSLLVLNYQIRIRMDLLPFGDLKNNL